MSAAPSHSLSMDHKANRSQLDISDTERRKSSAFSQSSEPDAVRDIRQQLNDLLAYACDLKAFPATSSKPATIDRTSLTKSQTNIELDGHSQRPRHLSAASASSRSEKPIRKRHGPAPTAPPTRSLPDVPSALKTSGSAESVYWPVPPERTPSPSISQHSSRSSNHRPALTLSTTALPIKKKASKRALSPDEGETTLVEPRETKSLIKHLIASASEAGSLDNHASLLDKEENRGRFVSSDLLESHSRPETSASNATSFTEADHQTWHVTVENLDEGEAINDEFTSTFGSPSLSDMLSNVTSATSPISDTDHQGMKLNRRARDTMSASMSSRGPLLLADNRREGGTGVPALAPSPPSPLQPGPTLLQRKSSKASTLQVQAPSGAWQTYTLSASQREREEKLARIRAQQEALLAEQRRLEQQASEMPTLIEDAEEVQDDALTHEIVQVERDWRFAKDRITPHPKRNYGPESITSPRAAQKEPQMHDRASEYEMSALRAQVSQLQLALKKQMAAGGMGAVTAHQRGARNNDFVGLPTPDESHSGGSLYSGIGGGGRMPQSPLHKAIDLSPGGGQQVSSSFMDEIQQHQQRHNADRPNTYRQAMSMGAPSIGGQNRYAPARSYAGQSEYSYVTGTSQQLRDRFFNDPSLTEDMMSNRSAGDFRVDELAAKLDRLEELFRFTALQQRIPHEEDNDTRRSSATHDRRSSLAADRLLQLHHTSSEQQRLTEQDEQNDEHSPSYSSSLCSSNVAGATVGTSVSTAAPSVASSGPFIYNATPTDLRTAPAATIGRQGSIRTASVVIGSSNPPIAQQFGSANSRHVPNMSMYSLASNAGTTSGLNANKQTAAVQRTGVSRFLLGATAKLHDVSDGKEVPSVHVSWSRKRMDERVEKPKTKVKSAGRGRVIVVQKEDKKRADG